MHQSTGHSLMILHHVQFSELSALTHQVHAGLLLLAAAFRVAPRVVEYTLLASLASLSFVFSSECPVRFAEDAKVNPAAYMLAVLAVGTLLWTWLLQIAWGGSDAVAHFTADKAHEHV